LPIDAASLRKILELERQKGYQDTAVFGGLDRFLANWSARAADSISPEFAEPFKKLKLGSPHYPHLSTEERRQWLEDVLAFLDRAEPDIKTASPAYASATAARPKRRVSTTKELSSTSLDSAITAVSGISSSLQAKFQKLGVKTIRDLLYHFPGRHLDYSRLKTISQLAEGREETIVANVWQVKLVNLGRHRSTEAILGDETGNVRAVWFGNPYLVKQLSTNKRVALSGRVKLFQGQFVFESPEWEVLEEKELIHTGRLVPVYSLTQGLRPRQMRKIIKAVVDGWAGQVADYVPPQIIDKRHLLKLPQAIRQAHFPDDETLKNRARIRLAFDELLLLQIGVLARKRQWRQGQPASPLIGSAPVLESFIASLPYQLTGAQQRVLEEILADLRKKEPMSRLLQGEVGSGKTVVATAALLTAAAAGYQGAFMAPTEILAEQHFSALSELLTRAASEVTEDDCTRSFDGILDRPLTLALLTGDVKGKAKTELKKRIQAGKVDIVIGTHALIQKEVGFKKLGMAVIDEQHRFGVTQRSVLRQKGTNPHLLAMTATPIPRTLALTLYGDLDLSVIDELPPGRQVIKTKWLKPWQRESAYKFISRQVSEGRQAFIVCPLIEESDAVQAKAATAEYQLLSSEVFPDLKLGLLHGRMSSKDKDAVMRAFRCGELHILVSTPVVEVGIDVPNATVMLVESADRFGLSQLHQFRGRVGRGSQQSYCMFLSETPSEIASKRLDIIESTQDGFALAEEDLKLRGPGEFFGTRQSGIPDLKMAKISDVNILEMARDEATRLFEEDPDLKKAEHRALAKEVARVWPDATEWS